MENGDGVITSRPLWVEPKVPLRVRIRAQVLPVPSEEGPPPRVTPPIQLDAEPAAVGGEEEQARRQGERVDAGSACQASGVVACEQVS